MFAWGGEYMERSVFELQGWFRYLLFCISLLVTSRSPSVPFLIRSSAELDWLVTSIWLLSFLHFSPCHQANTKHMSGQGVCFPLIFFFCYFAFLCLSPAKHKRHVRARGVFGWWQEGWVGLGGRWHTMTHYGRQMAHPHSSAFQASPALLMSHTVSSYV